MEKRKTRPVHRVAPLPRFDFGLIMGLAEQLQLGAVKAFQIATREWQLAMEVLNVRVEMRWEDAKNGWRPLPRTSSPQSTSSTTPPAFTNTLSELPTVKEVGTPIHAGRQSVRRQVSSPF